VQRQVYVHLQTAQAATALKHQLDVVYKDQAHAKKPTAIFNPPHVNPFKTLPKDVPARDKNRGDRASSGNYSGNQGGGGGGNFNRYNNNNRGNFNNRGNQNNMGFQNRNFSGPAGGNMGGNMGGFNPNPMNNFTGGAMGMNNNFGGGFNRGGMMSGNMRGGMNPRGGRGGMMGGMGGMGMAPMGGNMGMMGGGMMGMGGNMGMMGGMGKFIMQHRGFNRLTQQVVQVASAPNSRISTQPSSTRTRVAVTVTGIPMVLKGRDRSSTPITIK
jgi:hypothetical protein